MPTVKRVAEYFSSYVPHYQREYSRFTAPHPEGGGYPKIPVSPYQYGSQLVCHLATDGVAIVDSSQEPSYQWYLIAGPAIKSDTEPTRTPAWLTKQLESLHAKGQEAGVYRVVSKTPIPAAVWSGDMGKPVESRSIAVAGVNIEIRRYRYNLTELTRRLTFGVWGLILDFRLGNDEGDFWRPSIIENFGFLPADLSARRFFRYAEFSHHADPAAWDPRAAWVRAHVDVRRDFARAISRQGKGGGSINPRTAETPIGPPFHDRLDALKHATDGLDELLRSRPDDPESVFHEYLVDHPVLIDVYGSVESKPRFEYPDHGPTGKKFVEPDFIVTYSNRTYRLIEIERPDHGLDTRVGHPRTAVTHAAYQIAEWKDFIANHYAVISDRYPGISSGLSTAVVVGRNNALITPHSDADQYMSLLRQQLSVDEVWTYDQLVSRARVAIAQLQALAVTLAEHGSARTPSP